MYCRSAVYILLNEEAICFQLPEKTSLYNSHKAHSACVWKLKDPLPYIPHRSIMSLPYYMNFSDIVATSAWYPSITWQQNILSHTRSVYEIKRIKIYVHEYIYIYVYFIFYFSIILLSKTFSSDNLKSLM